MSAFYEIRKERFSLGSEVGGGLEVLKNICDSSTSRGSDNGPRDEVLN